MADAPIADDRRAKRNTAILAAAQAVLGAQMPILFVIGGLVGAELSPNPRLATLPISLIVFGSMTTTPWISPLMQRRGRRAGFVIGGLAGALGAALAALGLLMGSFAVLLLGSYVTGIYMSAQGFYRFAAADSASDSFGPKATSWVMAGDLVPRSSASSSTRWFSMPSRCRFWAAISRSWRSTSWGSPCFSGSTCRAARRPIRPSLRPLPDPAGRCCVSPAFWWRSHAA